MRKISNVLAFRRHAVYEMMMPVSDEVIKNLPEKLLAFCKKYNISAHEMADMMGINYTTYHYLESKSRPAELHHYRMAAGVMASVNAAVKKYCLS